MSKTRPVEWLSGQAVTGLKDLPRNGAWLLSKVLASPAAIAESATDIAPDGLRRVGAAMADTLPGGRDSVEIRVRRAEAAVARAKKAEQEALAEAQNAAALADTARTTGDDGKEQLREASREGKREVDQRTQEAREHFGQLIEQEREKAAREVAARMDRVSADVAMRSEKARRQAEEAAERAQARIDEAHQQMAAARAIAAEATAAAQEVAEQAHRHAKAVADEAQERAGSAERRLNSARSTESRLTRNTARAVQAEQKQDVPARLTELTKAELLEIAEPLQVTGAARMTKSQLVRKIRTASRTKARR